MSAAGGHAADSPSGPGGRPRSGRRRVTMVKKVGADGRPCRKCREVESILDKEGLAAAIDRIVVADVRFRDGEGWRIARRHGVDVAPFFVVEDGDEVRVFTVFRRLVRDVLRVPRAPGSISGDGDGPADPEAVAALGCL